MTEQCRAARDTQPEVTLERVNPRRWYVRVPADAPELVERRVAGYATGPRHLGGGYVIPTALLSMLALDVQAAGATVRETTVGAR